MNAPLALLLALCSPGFALDPVDPHVSVAPPPTWVEPIEAPVATPAPLGQALESAQYLLVDDQVRVSADSVERYAHTSYRIVTREGLDALSRMEVVFDPAWANVELHSLRIWREGAWLDRLDGAHATVIREEPSLWQHIFDGTRKLVVVMPDVRVGDVVDMAWSVDGLDPVFDGHYGEAWPMAWGVPAQRRQLRLLWSADRQLRVRGFDLAPPSSSSPADGWREARWDLSRVLPVTEDFDMPVGYEPYAWAQASDFASWEAVVDWALGVYTLPPQAHPAVQALADRLWAQTGTPEGFVGVAARWVQDEVRYFGMEVGDASHVPHAPELVLERRYGDCKDKSLLLVALLRARGVEAYPALVSRSSQEAIAGMLPSPLVFDHVIAIVRLGGRRVAIDATERDQGGAVAETWIPAFGKALPVAPGVTELVDLPAPTLPQGRSTVEHRYDLRGDPERPGLEVHSVFEGYRAEEMRRVLADISITRLQDDYLDHYAQLGYQVSPVVPIAIQDDRAGNRLELTESYAMRSPWRPVAEGVDELLLPPASIFDWLPGVVGLRNHPLALPAGLDERERIVVRVEPGWELEQPEAEVLSPWFEFSASSSFDEGELGIDYQLRVLRDRVEPHELQGYQAALERMHAARGYALERGDQGWDIPWDFLEKLLAFLVAVFAVTVAVPISVFASAVLVWLGMPRRSLER
jgi:transglutaminase-like putative cysteine protease